MSDPILLEVVTPERKVFSAQVSELQFPTATRGYYGILPGHTPLVTPVGNGLLYFVQNGEKHWLTVFGGFAEVGPDAVTVLARQSETVDMIDLTQVQAEFQRAQGLVKSAQGDTNAPLKNTVLEANYIGRRAYHLIGGYNINQAEIFKNGFLQAFNTVQAGGDSPLINKLLLADSRRFQAGERN